MEPTPQRRRAPACHHLASRVHHGLREQLDEQEMQTLSARGRALTRDEMRRFVFGELDPIDA